MQLSNVDWKMVVKMEVILPKELEKLQTWKTDFPNWRYAWLSNEEIASILITFQKHGLWMTDSRVHR